MEERKLIKDLLVSISKTKEETMEDLIYKLDVINEIIKLLLSFVSSKSIIDLDTWTTETLNKMTIKRNELLRKIYIGVQNENMIYDIKKTQN